MIQEILGDAKFLYGPNKELEQLKAKRMEAQRIANELKAINSKMDEEHERIRLESLQSMTEMLKKVQETNENVVEAVSDISPNSSSDSTDSK